MFGFVWKLLTCVGVISIKVLLCFLMCFFISCVGIIVFVECMSCIVFFGFVVEVIIGKVGVYDVYLFFVEDFGFVYDVVCVALTFVCVILKVFKVLVRYLYFFVFYFFVYFFVVFVLVVV